MRYEDRPDWEAALMMILDEFGNNQRTSEEDVRTIYTRLINYTGGKIDPTLLMAMVNVIIWNRK